MHFKILIIFFLSIANSQKCLNHAGKEVSWFLVLITPGTLQISYHYFDSESKDGFAFRSSRPDDQNHPIYNTLSTLSNSTYQIIAWNDQLPNGSTSSSKAHSKTIVGYNLDASSGIVMVHSMPTYPDIKNKSINATVSDSQRIYGQHFFCFNSGADTKEILTKASIINPYYYANTKKDNFTMTSANLFQYTNLDVGANRIKIIFKNGKVNGSIFEDGLTVMLGSDMIAESWGRPIMAPWCGNTTNLFKVGNVANLKFEDGTSWKQSLDHSKWAITANDRNNYSCFGDMNRMESQFKRGGAFYCIESAGLKKAMRAIIDTPAVCLQKQ